MTQITEPPPPRSARRRSPLAVLAVTVLVALGAAAGATAIFAGRTQTIAQDLTTQLNTTIGASGVASVTQTGYRRGLTSSTQTLDMKVQPQGSDTPFEVILTNHIQHGPLPGLRGVGQAIVDTEVSFPDPQVQAAYVRAFPNRRPTLHTVVGLGGRTDTALDVPAGSVNSGADTVTWQAAHGTITVAGEVSSTAMTWPGLTVVSQGGGATLSGISVDGTSRRDRAVGMLGTGSGSLAVQRVSVSGGGQNVELGGLKVSSEAAQKGGYYDTAVKYDLGTLKVAGQTYTDVQLHLGIGHLAASPLERLVTLMQDLQKGAAAPVAGRPAVPELSAAQQRQVQTDLLALLKDRPVVRFDRLSLRLPTGGLSVSGQIGVPGAATLSADQVAQVAQTPAALLGLLDMSFDVQGSEAAIQELAGAAGPSGQGIAQNLRAMEQAGFVTRSGGQLETRLRFQDGALTMNGRSLGE